MACGQGLDAIGATCSEQYTGAGGGAFVEPASFPRYGDALVARCDLKAERAAGVLRVQSVHWEPGAPAEARPALSDELRLMARWLGLEEVLVVA